MASVVLTRIAAVTGPAGSTTAGARHCITARLPATATTLATVHTPSAFCARCNKHVHKKKNSSPKTDKTRGWALDRYASHSIAYLHFENLYSPIMVDNSGVTSCLLTDSRSHAYIRCWQCSPALPARQTHAPVSASQEAPLAHRHRSRQPTP